VHVSNILSKLGVQSRTQATLYAIRIGLVSAIGAVMNMMRKGQVQGVNKGDITGQVTFIARLFGVAAKHIRKGSLLAIAFL